MTRGTRAADGSQRPPVARETPRRRKRATDTPLTAQGALWAFLAATMTERQFQRIVEDSLRQRGYLVWHVADSRLMSAGLPDVIAVHPTRAPRRVIFWELKSQVGRVKPEQKAALAALEDVYGVDARVLRPSDWPAELESLDAEEGGSGR